MDDLALRILYQQGLREVMKRASAHEGTDYFTHNYMETKSTRDVLSQMIGPGAIPLRISMFNRDGDYIDFGWQPVNGELIHSRFLDGTAEYLMDDVDARGGGRLVRLPEQDLWYDKVSNPVISVYREFRDLYYRYGYIHIQEPFSRLEDYLELDLPGAWFVLRTGEGQVIYPEQEVQEHDNTGRYRVLRKSSEYSGWQLSLYQDSSIYRSRVRSMMLITLLITLLLLVVGSVVISVLTNILTSPLRELHESIYRVNLQNLSITLEEKDSHRIVKQLNDGFKIMFQGLQDSVQEQLLSRDRESQAHMTALQNRMNPHLLHNMLSHISSLAAEEETERIEELCQRLSRSLRYLSGESGSRVTMGDEMHHLLDYLNLMKSHYDPLFDFSIDWDEDELMDITVPKLIFQPLAENAFDHGFQNAEPPWCMNVHIEKSAGGGWQAEFRDNGGGMSKKKRDELLAIKTMPLAEARSRAINQPPGGMAMINMIVRLRLLYGDDMIFELESREGKHMVKIGGHYV